MSIKNLAEDDRPREKFLAKGKDALSDQELLAIILGSGNLEDSAVTLAEKILASADNNWHRLSLFSLKDLMKFKGIGPVKAIEVSTALEIGRRRAGQEVPELHKVEGAYGAYLEFSAHMRDLRTEEFWAVFLNHGGTVLHKCRLASGGISSSLVDVRVLYKTALDHYATAVVVAHNHPSGILKPSAHDIEITKKIADAGKILDIVLLDHLIISDSGYFSFNEECLL